VNILLRHSVGYIESECVKDRHSLVKNDNLIDIAR